MKKGITPIISIIVLLLITVALAGVAWVYLSGFLGTQMATITIPPNGAYCAGNNVEVLVANTGQDDLAATDIPVKTMVEPGGNAVPGTLADSITAGKSGIIQFACTASPCSGDYDISIGTSGAVQTLSVSC